MAQGNLDPLLQVQIDAINKRLDDLDKISIERIEHVRENVAAALSSADRAISKAETAADKRFDSVNEFRSAMSDQAQSFVRHTEYASGHASIVEKVESLTTQFIAVDTVVRNKTASAVSATSFMVASVSVFVLLIIAITSGAIQLGSVQTHVSINTDTLGHLLDRERTQDANYGTLNSLIESTRTRMMLNENRIDRLEKKPEQ